MFGCVYTFERALDSALQLRATSTIAETAIETCLADQPRVRFVELTEPQDPKPMFTVLFRDASSRRRFEEQFDSALEACGLRVCGVPACA